SFEIAQRELPGAAQAFLASQGRLTVVALIRAMARRSDGEAALVELKAVDETYPLARGPVLDPALPLSDALAERDGVFGVVADAALVARLNLTLGSRITIGGAEFELR